MSERGWEYVIVGGGVYGAATAWYLARAGAEVLVLEGRAVASGASGGLGKRGVRANGRDIRELPLMRAAYEMWPTLEADLGHPTGWEQVGHLRLYERHHDVGPAAVRAQVQSAAGIPTRHLELADVREIEPGVSDVVLGALHCPKDGVADHGATTAGYAARASEAGAVIREDAAVSGVVAQGGRGTSVVLEGGEHIEVRGDVLLLANTGVAPLVSSSFGRSLPVWRVFPQAMCTAPLDQPPFRSLFGHAHRRLALKALPDGSAMVSGGWRGRWDPVRKEPETHPDAVRGNFAEAVRIFPALEGLEPSIVRTDRAESSCIDDIPIIDRLPEAPNVLVACGWSGHGWAIAPAVAPMIAEWAREGGDAPILLRPFGLERFG